MNLRRRLPILAAVVMLVLAVGCSSNKAAMPVVIDTRLQTASAATATSVGQMTETSAATQTAGALSAAGTASESVARGATNSPIRPRPSWSYVAPSDCKEDLKLGTYSFLSGTTVVSGYFARPADVSNPPAVIVLHTRGGLTTHERDVVNWLADAGFAAFAPDYFSAVGESRIPSDDAVMINAMFARSGERILTAVTQASDCMTMNYLSGSPVSVVGFSLGASVGHALASTPGMGSLVAWYGAGLTINNTQFSIEADAARIENPVLILHGDLDQPGLTSFARKFASARKSAGKQVELVIYPGVGHAWDQTRSPIYVYDANATADARSRTIAFFTAAAR